jgi:hypothetical protein
MSLHGLFSIPSAMNYVAPCGVSVVCRVCLADGFLVRAGHEAERNGRFNVAVSFDERGYVGTHPELRSPVAALSLGGLRRLRC